MRLALTTQELIRSKGRLTDRILRPYHIPLHPRIYDSTFAYTPEFLKYVIQKIPSALITDVEVMSILLDHDFKLNITDEWVEELDTSSQDPFKRRLYSSIEHSVDSSKKTISVGVNATTIGQLGYKRSTMMQNTGGGTRDPEHPMDLEKLRLYVDEESGPYLIVPTWYQHNIWDMGRGLFHYMRAFAIAFNNQGLKELGLE